MSYWGNVLREARTRAKLTQEQLAAKVPMSVSYIRKMETGLLGPPKRKKAEDLAAALSITDPKKRNKFFHAAGVGNDEDMEGLELTKVANGQSEEEKEQENGAIAYSTANAALGIPDSLLDPLGGELKEIKHLIDAASLTDEQEEVVASHLDTLKRLLKLFAAQ